MFQLPAVILMMKTFRFNSAKSLTVKNNCVLNLSTAVVRTATNGVIRPRKNTGPGQCTRLDDWRLSLNGYMLMVIGITGYRARIR